MLADGSLLVVSPDRTKLVACSAEGEFLWEKSLGNKSSLARGRNGDLLLLGGPSVFKLNAKDGEITPLREFPEISRIRYDEDSGLFLGRPRSEHDQALRFYRGDTGEPLTTVEKGESVILSEPELVIVACAERKPVEGGYTFNRCWLEAFQPSDGRKLWVVEPQQEKDPYLSCAKVGRWLVLKDGSDWMLVEVSSGEVFHRPIDRISDAFGPTGLREKDGKLTFIISGMNTKNFNRSKHTVFTVSIPDFKTVAQTGIEVIEAALTEDAGDYLITDSLYRTACFRRDGTKVWEHFQMHRTPAIGGIIYFADFKDDKARLGSISVATGEEKIFRQEPVSMNK